MKNSAANCLEANVSICNREVCVFESVCREKKTETGVRSDPTEIMGRDGQVIRQKDTEELTTEVKRVEVGVET